MRIGPLSVPVVLYAVALLSAAATAAAPAVDWSKPQIVRVELVVHPGETADIDLVPQRPGHYDLTCADHDWDGMVGSIEVQ